ncbi:MAG: Mrp/NBP35 family ATP-binding protein [Acidimicrobiales bacterium]
MSIDEAQVRSTAGEVVEPHLRLPLSVLGMVRSVRVKRHRVSVEVVLPVDGFPAAVLTDRLRAALGVLPDVHEVMVEPSVMSDEQRRRLRMVLRGEAARGPTGDPGELSDHDSHDHDSHDHDSHDHDSHDHGTQAGSAPALGHEDGRPNRFMEPRSRTRVLGISSGKGGVGKSSVTVNLAVTLARLGHDVGILDADVYGFSVPKMLGVRGDPLIIDDLVVPPEANGVRCLSMGFFVPDETPIIWRGPMLHKALEQFLVDAYWGEPDYLLVDMPPGTGDVTLSLGQYLTKTEVYVVTTPQAAAQRVAQRSAYAARKLKLAVRGVVENMSWFTGDDGTRYELFGSGGGASLAADLQVPLLGQVPLIPALREGGDEGVPVVVAEPDGEAAAAFSALAARIDELGPARVYRKELIVR